MAAFGVAVALAVPPTLAGGARTRVLVALAAIGLIATLGAMVWTIRLLPWALLALGAEYTISWLGRAAISARAALIGAGLLVLAELAQWSIAVRSPAWERWMDRQRIGDVAILGVGSTAVAALVLVLASFPIRASFWLSALGAAAASATVGLVVLLVRRARRRQPL